MNELNNLKNKYIRLHHDIINICKLDTNRCDSFHLLSNFRKTIWSTTFKLQIQYISRYTSSVVVYCIITRRTSKRKDADTHLFNNVT